MSPHPKCNLHGCKRKKGNPALLLPKRRVPQCATGPCCHLQWLAGCECIACVRNYNRHCTSDGLRERRHQEESEREQLDPPTRTERQTRRSSFHSRSRRREAAAERERKRKRKRSSRRPRDSLHSFTQSTSRVPVSVCTTKRNVLVDFYLAAGVVVKRGASDTKRLLATARARDKREGFVCCCRSETRWKQIAQTRTDVRNR